MGQSDSEDSSRRSRRRERRRSRSRSPDGHRRSRRSRMRSSSREHSRRSRRRDTSLQATKSPSRVEVRAKDRAEEPAAHAPSPAAVASVPRAEVTESAGEISCSVAETNRIRIMLGLKPLEGTDEDGSAPVAQGTSKNPISITLESTSEKLEREALQERIKRSKERRELAKALQGGSSGGMSLGQQLKMQQAQAAAATGSDDVAALSWVERSRRLDALRLEQEKQEAEEAARRQAEEEAQMQRAYTASHLSGLKVQHQVSDLHDGEQVILTLRDTGVLDDDAEDTLENVNLAEEDKRREREKEMKRMSRPDYDPFKEQEIDPITGQVKPRGLLAKFDGPEKASAGAVLTGSGVSALGGDGGVDHAALEALRKKAAMAVDLDTKEGGIKLASEYYTPDEMVAFGKPKQKKKKKKKDKKDKKGKKRSSRRADVDDVFGPGGEDEDGGQGVQDGGMGAAMDEDSDDDHATRGDRRRHQAAVGEEQREAMAANRQAFETALAKADAMAPGAAAAFADQDGAEEDPDAAASRAARRVTGSGLKVGVLSSKGSTRTFSGHRQYNFGGDERRAAALDQAVLEDDADLAASLMKARALSMKTRAKEKERQRQEQAMAVDGEAEDDSDDGLQATGAAAVAARLRKAGAGGRQFRGVVAASAPAGQGGEDGAGVAGGVSFSTTTEFSRRLQARAVEEATASVRRQEEVAEREEAEEQRRAAVAAAKEGGRDGGDAGEEGEGSGHDEGGKDANGGWVAMHEDEAMEEGEEEEGGAHDEGEDGEGADGLFGSEPLASGGVGDVLRLLERQGEIVTRGEAFFGRAGDKKPVRATGADTRVNPRDFSHEKDRLMASREVRLEYRDEHGNLLTQKERYRQFNYDFHGIRPSKNAKDRRARRMADMVASGAISGPTDKKASKATKKKGLTTQAHVVLSKG